MSRTRKIKKGVVTQRNLTASEVLELQEMQRLVNARNFEATQVKANTALVPRGQEVANELEAIVRLLENVKNQWVSQKLTECGYDPGAKCSINLATGEVVLTPDVEPDIEPEIPPEVLKEVTDTINESSDSK